MNYEQSLEFIGSRLRFGIKPGLERTEALLERLGKPQGDLRFIHVAGTNGKGSACAMISAGLRKKGLRVGLYTSPYICDFRERMQINGEMIPRDELAALTAEVAEHLLPDEEVTEFELITCIAFLWFARKKCDIVVLEVGLGGRLDSTNVIAPPVCSVIMRIDFDHTAVLGNTLAEIAGEKAGIIKTGAPVVIYPDQPDEAMNVLLCTAEERGCLVTVPDLKRVTVRHSDIHGADIDYGGLALHVPFIGQHQITNAVTAVEALRVAGLSDDEIAAGIPDATIPARLELLCQSPLVLLDGAHNPNGASALANAVDRYLVGKKIFAVMGVLADKDYSAELSMLAPRFAEVFTCDGFSPRCLSAEELADGVRKYTPAVSCGSPQEAFDRAFEKAKFEDAAVVICGSLYLAGAVRRYIIERTE